MPYSCAKVWPREGGESNSPTESGQGLGSICDDRAVGGCLGPRRRRGDYRHTTFFHVQGDLLQAARLPASSLKDLSSEGDPRAPPTLAEFLGHAWEAAKEKARELGWIV